MKSNQNNKMFNTYAFIDNDNENKMKKVKYSVFQNKDEKFKQQYLKQYTKYQKCYEYENENYFVEFIDEKRGCFDELILKSKIDNKKSKYNNKSKIITINGNKEKVINGVKQFCKKNNCSYKINENNIIVNDNKIKKTIVKGSESISETKQIKKSSNKQNKNKVNKLNKNKKKVNKSNKKHQYQKQNKKMKNNKIINKIKKGNTKRFNKKNDKLTEKYKYEKMIKEIRTKIKTKMTHDSYKQLCKNIVIELKKNKMQTSQKCIYTALKMVWNKNINNQYINNDCFKLSDNCFKLNNNVKNQNNNKNELAKLKDKMLNGDKKQKSKNKDNNNDIKENKKHTIKKDIYDDRDDYNYSRNRHYFCTWFTIGENILDLLEEHKDILRGCHYVVEPGDKKGRLHYQFGFDLYYPKSLMRVKTIFDDSIHLELRKGTVKQLDNYLMKTGEHKKNKFDKDQKIVKWGDLRDQGQRTTHEEIIYNIEKNNYSLEDIKNEYAKHFILYYKKYQKVIEMRNKKESKKFRKIDVTLIKGSTGTNKTRSVMYYVNKIGCEKRRNNVYKITGDELLSGWFQDYEGENILLIDEYSNQLKITRLLNILDGHELRLNIKGSHTYAKWEKVIITTNLNKLHKNAKKAHIEALKRRINKIISIGKLEENELNENEKYEQLLKDIKNCCGLGYIYKKYPKLYLIHKNKIVDEIYIRDNIDNSYNFDNHIINNIKRMMNDETEPKQRAREFSITSRALCAVFKKYNINDQIKLKLNKTLLLHCIDSKLNNNKPKIIKNSNDEFEKSIKEHDKQTIKFCKQRIYNICVLQKIHEKVNKIKKEYDSNKNDLNKKKLNEIQIEYEKCKNEIEQIYKIFKRLFNQKEYIRWCSMYNIHNYIKMDCMKNIKKTELKNKNIALLKLNEIKPMTQYIYDKFYK